MRDPFHIGSIEINKREDDAAQEQKDTYQVQRGVVILFVAFKRLSPCCDFVAEESRDSLY